MKKTKYNKQTKHPERKRKKEQQTNRTKHAKPHHTNTQHSMRSDSTTTKHVHLQKRQFFLIFRPFFFVHKGRRKEVKSGTLPSMEWQRWMPIIGIEDTGHGGRIHGLIKY